MNHIENVARRSFLRNLAGTASWPLLAALGPALWRAARAQTTDADARKSAAVLPLATTGLEHLGMLVPDVERAGQFYGRVFNPALHKERDPPLRYYVTLGASYLAIGAAGERPTQFDHYCALVEGYDRAALAARLEAEHLPPGRFGMIGDPDGLRLQLLGTPGGLAASTEPAARTTDEPPVVGPLGLDHIVLRVSDLERALPFYRLFFGAEALRTSSPERVWFAVAHTRLGLEPAQPGQAPCIHHVAIRVAAYDRAAVPARLRELGAEVADADEEDVLRFRDPNGLIVELTLA